MSGPVVVLVGPPGVGKTSVGRLLARALEVELRDTDRDIEEQTGSSVADLFVTEGEPHFRDLEVAAVANALANHPGVLTLGGGAVTEARTRQALAGHRVVFLDVGLSDVMRRLGMNRSRPLLLGNVRQQWMRLMDQRRPLYQEVAAATVNTDGRSAADVAKEIEEMLSVATGADGA
ncbi:MAG: shikimate kinase [Actinomycetes bacterium]